ncbi:hypothetical protein HOE425_330356 [Hoeflea sp. EC-HK425]|nr:hypothetical protein HOE425_330356 [Hoeflea sp. EC-HK425]
MDQRGLARSVVILVTVGSAIQAVLDRQRINNIEYIAVLDLGVAQGKKGGTDKTLARCLGTLLKNIVMQFDIAEPLIGPLDQCIVDFADLLFRHRLLLRFRRSSILS